MRTSRLGLVISSILGASACGSPPQPPPGPDPAVRGRYIVEHLAACGDCHTPRDATGAPDPTRLLAGVDCLFDAVPADPTMGCLSSLNLTNDPTGLQAMTDAQIKDEFLNGIEPIGEFLFPLMPYWEFHNMTPQDADAIVAYLRTVPAVSHVPAANQPPFDQPLPAPAVPIDMTTVPSPSTGGANYDSALRGRYLASVLANCIACHTPDDTSPTAPRPIDMTRPFQGGHAFPAAAFGLPSPPFPTNIYAWNLTQDSTGLAGFTVQDIVREMQTGRSPDNMGICPPMPVGPMGAFGGMTTADATDIANYILTLPVVRNAIPNDCGTP